MKNRVISLLVSVALGMAVAAPYAAHAGPAPTSAKPAKPPAPVVSKLTPATGPEAGGTVVRIKGKNLTGARKVLFGKAKGTGLKVKSAKKLTVVAPPGTGAVDVRVVTRGGKSKAGAASFTYTHSTTTPPPPPPPPPGTPAPTVSLVSPGSGPTTGGTVVTVTGSNLIGASAVTFGGVAGTGLTGVTASGLTVTSPAHVPGTVDVRVTTPGGSSAVVAADHFTYVAPSPPSVTSISPTSGPTGGGTSVTVTGTGFTGATAVTFDGVPGTGLTGVTATSATVTSPPHDAGTVHVRVVGAALSDETAADLFTYELPPGQAPLPGDAIADPDVSLDGVACPADDVCFAVGGYRGGTGGEHPLVERLAAGSWTPSSPPLPGNAHVTDTQARLTAIACVSTTFCIAVGSYHTTTPDEVLPLVETWNGTAWVPTGLALPADHSTAYEHHLLSSVSCASTTSCVAVGQYNFSSALPKPLLVRLDGTTWTTDDPVLPAGFVYGGLQDVDCAAAQNCLAVGQFEKTATHGHPLTQILQGTDWTYGVDTVPVDASATNPAAGLQSVDCTTATACSAVGSYATATSMGGMVVTLTGISWSTASTAAVGASVTELAFHDVQCLGVGSCVAVGAERASNVGHAVRMVVTGSGGSIADVPVTGIKPGSSTVGATAVACTSLTHCLGVGFFEAPTLLEAMLMHLGASLTADAAAAPAGHQAAHLNDVAIPVSTSSAVSVGTFEDAQGHDQGLLLTGLVT